MSSRHDRQLGREGPVPNLTEAKLESAISETRSPLTRATRCLYSSRKADSHSGHQLRDTQLETLCENVKRVETRLLGAVLKKM